MDPRCAGWRDGALQPHGAHGVPPGPERLQVLGRLKSGPAGAVEIKPGQPIEIRALLSDTVVPSVSPLVQAAIEMAIKDFGSINGHPVSLENPRRDVLGRRRARDG